MARGAKGRIYVLVEFDETETDEGAGAATKRLPHRIEYKREFSSGTTNGTQMDRVWSTDVDLTTTPVDVDVVGTANLPSVLDAGNNVNLTDVCVLCVVNDDPAGGDNAVLGASSAPFTGMLPAGDVANVLPEGILLWVAPHGAGPTATTADLIRLVANANTAAIRALIAGRSL